MEITNKQNIQIQNEPQVIFNYEGQIQKFSAI